LHQCGNVSRAVQDTKNFDPIRNGAVEDQVPTKPTDRPKADIGQMCFGKPIDGTQAGELRQPGGIRSNRLIKTKCVPQTVERNVLRDFVDITFRLGSESRCGGSS
jgi:hypothetical protein